MLLSRLISLVQYRVDHDFFNVPATCNPKIDPHAILLGEKKLMLLLLPNILVSWLISHQDTHVAVSTKCQAFTNGSLVLKVKDTLAHFSSMVSCKLIFCHYIM